MKRVKELAQENRKPVWRHFTKNQPANTTISRKISTTIHGKLKKMYNNPLTKMCSNVYERNDHLTEYYRQSSGAFRLNPALFCGIKDNLRTDASTTTRAMQWKYYQLGGFLASTEAHWSYNWPIIIHALNQDASTGVGGVGKAPVLLSVEFAPYRVQAKTAHQIPYAVNFALLIDSDQLCSY